MNGRRAAPGRMRRAGNPRVQRPIEGGDDNIGMIYVAASE